jgi:8-oxo-dGTP pyrophosphatase MutT (NUDIX family)
MRIQPAVAVLVFNKKNPDEILVVEHGPESENPTGLICIPGGRKKRVSNGFEEDRQAAVRELQEETGLVADPKSLREAFFIPELEINRKAGQSIKISCRVYYCDEYRQGVFFQTGETTPGWLAVEVLQGMNETSLVHGTKQAVEEGIRFRDNLIGQEGVADKGRRK